jgi:hypothetical protein
MKDYRDGQQHEVGPLRIRYSGEDKDGLEIAACEIVARGGKAYRLDFAYAVALAEVFDLFPSLFSASASDRGNANPEGYVRLRVSSSPKHGALAAKRSLRGKTANEIYQLARLVMNARLMDHVQTKGSTQAAQRDYRRKALRIETGLRARKDTRQDLLNAIHWRVEATSGKAEADKAYKRIMSLFTVADAETGSPNVTTVMTPFPSSTPTQGN